MYDSNHAVSIIISKSCVMYRCWNVIALNIYIELLFTLPYVKILQFCFCYSNNIVIIILIYFINIDEKLTYQK
jgi:hypothetical protein